MSQTTDAVIAELMDRRLLNDVDSDLHQEIAEAVIKAAQPNVKAEGGRDEPVAIKPLEWTQSPPPAHEHEPFVYWAAGIGGHYRAERNGLLWMAHDAFIWVQHASQKAAKAAAQADYEQRIRSALVAHPASPPDLEAIRAEERERCARVVEQFGQPYALNTNTGAMMFRAEVGKIASAIRTGGQK
jgi:hypothetical protein